MAIQLGTVAAVGFEEFPPLQWLGCYRELGCQVVQVYRNQNANVTLDEINAAIDAGQMPCDSLHGVYGEEYDPSNPIETHRTFAVDAFKAEGELALKLGGEIVIVHCASIRTEGVSADERTKRVAQLEKSIAELGEFGSSIGVRYAFENLPSYHAIGSDAGELANILTQINAPNTGMCFDTGHANMVCDPAAAIRQVAGQIIYVHLSDNSGNADDHEIPYRGTMDVDAVAEALHDESYSGTVMLEIFYNLDQLKRTVDEGYAERFARMLQIANGSPVK
jgi:sugar phosphate isomerase/epimerase